MPNKQTFLRADQFQPHPADAGAIQQLLNLRHYRFTTFGVTPRGRVYGVHGCLADSNVDALLQLPELIEVSVQMASIAIFTDKGLERLFAHPSLRIFGCAQNPALTDRSAASLSMSRRMQWLCLNNCAITDIGVQSISEHRQLLGLYLAGTQLTEVCVPYLCCLTNLRRLRLSQTLVTERFRDTLSAHLPKCLSIKLGQTAG